MKAQMGTEIRSCILFFHAFILLQCLCGCCARKIAKEDRIILDCKEQQSTEDSHLPSYAKKTDDYGQKPIDQKNVNEGDQPKRLDQRHVEGNHKDLAINVFFTTSDLQVGKRIPIYFPIKNPSSKPPLLSREEADSIPFSSSKLPYLLDFFSFSKDTSQARAMKDTLRHCEFEPINGETKFCATSLESMLDSARDIFGTDTPFKVITTNHLTKSSSLLQNYTITDEPKILSAPKMIACHTLPYPYAVFYCHGQKSDNKLFKVSLLGDNGGKIDAAAICHMDTSKWDPNHVAFQVLKTEPGRSPVCHFFPEDNLVWVASSCIP